MRVKMAFGLNIETQKRQCANPNLKKKAYLTQNRITQLVHMNNNSFKNSILKPKFITFVKN